MAKILTNTTMTKNQMTDKVSDSEFLENKLSPKTYKYLIPSGQDGFYYEPEILEVLEKFAKVRVNLSDPASLEVLSSDIGKRIREIPLQTVELPDGPVRLINSDPMAPPKDG